MSKNQLNPVAKRELWFNAHGRCEMCNKPLYRDGVTMLKVNLSDYAHIIADSPEGPRGDIELSPMMAKDPSNYILLCKDHHRLIDSAGGVKKFGVELLHQYKKDHEGRIEYVTGLSPEKKSLVVCYAPKIGDRLPSITTSETTDTIFPEMYPMTPEPIRLDARNIPYTDNQRKYWEVLPDILIENFKLRLADKIVSAPHISLFAIAPQPLLILLGTLIGDLYKVEIMQKQRKTKSWKWLSRAKKNEFHFIRPDNKQLEPVLIFALSASDILERVKRQMGEGFSYWIITCDKPNRDMMKTKLQLSKFGELLNVAISEINEASVGKFLHIFPAMPVSACVMFGHIRLHKADLPWVLYDLPQGSEEYVKTITIE